MTRFIGKTPELVSAWNMTDQDSGRLEIAVVDVEHLDAVASESCLLTETSDSIIPKTLRQHRVVLAQSKAAKETAA